MPSLVVGLGSFGFEVLRWLKMGLEEEEGVVSDQVALLAFVHADPTRAQRRETGFPLTDEDIIFLPIDLRYSPPWPCSWWDQDWLSRPTSVLPQGRLLWFWDRQTHQKIVQVLRAQHQRFGGQPFQFIVIGSPQEREFGMWYELVLWAREAFDFSVERIYLIAAFPFLQKKEGTSSAFQKAVLRHLSHMLERRVHFLLDEEGARGRFVKRSPLVTRTFLFPYEQPEPWVYSAVANLAFLFLDNTALTDFRAYLEGTMFLVESVATMALPTAVMRLVCKHRWLCDLLGCSPEAQPIPNRGRQAIQEFFTLSWGTGHDRYFAALWEVYEHGAPRTVPPLPDPLAVSWRRRLSSYLNRVMNNEKEGWWAGWKRAQDFLTSLQRFLRKIKTLLQRASAVKQNPAPAQRLLKDWEDIESTLASFQEELQSWGAMWGVSSSDQAPPLLEHLEQGLRQAEKQVNDFLKTGQKVMHWAGQAGVADVHNLSSRICSQVRPFVPRWQWRWTEASDGSPALTLVPTGPEGLEITREYPWTFWRQRLEHLYDRAFRQYLKQQPPLSLPGTGRMAQGPSFIDRQALVRRVSHPLQSSGWLFYPSSWEHEAQWPDVQWRIRQDGIGQFVSWRFPYRATRIHLIRLHRLTDLIPSTPSFTHRALYAYPEEQAFVSLEQKGYPFRWHPDFVSMLAAEQALEKLCLAWLYRCLRLEAKHLLFVPPHDPSAAVRSPTVGGRTLAEAFREALIGWWERDPAWQWWWHALEQGLGRYLQERRQRPWAERFRELNARRQDIRQGQQRHRDDDLMWNVFQFCLLLLDREQDDLP